MIRPAWKGRRVQICKGEVIGRLVANCTSHQPLTLLRLQPATCPCATPMSTFKESLAAQKPWEFVIRPSSEGHFDSARTCTAGVYQAGHVQEGKKCVSGRTCTRGKYSAGHVRQVCLRVRIRGQNEMVGLTWCSMHAIEEGGAGPREEDAIGQDSLGDGGQRPVLYSARHGLCCTAL
jgi:hypothetical protein